MFKELNGDPIAKLHYVGFLCVDNNKDVSSAIFQIMCRMFVTMTTFNASNIKTQLKIHVISYYKMNGRTILKKMWVQTILLLQKRLTKK